MQLYTVKEFYLRDHTGRELAVYDMNTNKIKLANIFGNGGMLGRIDVSYAGGTGYTRYYYLKDHLGSTRVEFDRYANVGSAYAYYAYGQISNSYNNSNPNNKYKFTGKERDTETNYDYFGARYYDSELGRWMSVDPLATNRIGLSPYNYVQNNPLNRFDPDGRTDWWALVKGVSLGVASIATGTAGVVGMVVASGGTAITFGTASPITVPTFIGSLGAMNLGVLGFAQSVIDVQLALQTPDGMTSEQFNIVKNVVKGFGGNKVTQEAVSLILNTIGLKGVSKIGEGTLQVLQVLVATNASTESIIDFLKAAAKKVNKLKTGTEPQIKSKDPKDPEEKMKTKQEQIEDASTKAWLKYDPSIR